MPPTDLCITLRGNPVFVRDVEIGGTPDSPRIESYTLWTPAGIEIDPETLKSWESAEVDHAIYAEINS